jgi:hypothetical protein
MKNLANNATHPLANKERVDSEVLGSFEAQERIIDDGEGGRKSTGQRYEGDCRDDDVLMMCRAPERELGLGLDNRFVASSRERFKGLASEIQKATHQKFWDARLENVRPLTDCVDFLKSGPVIWSHMGLQASRVRVARMLGLQHVDRKTANAAEIAMFSSFNTSLSVPDMETIAFTLGAFIYAHPELKHMSRKGQFELPFSDDTAYSLLKPHGFAF